jgi:hypothetical protein
MLFEINNLANQQQVLMYVQKPYAPWTIDFEKGRTGHGISDISYYGLFRPSLLQ